MTDSTPPTVSTQQADFILFNRHSLRLLAAGILPKSSTSLVLRRVTGGTEDSKVELAAIERATLTGIVGDTETTGEVGKALRAHVADWPLDRRLAFECAVHFWYNKGLTWRKVSRKAHYSPKQCSWFCDAARKCVAAWLSKLPGTTMEDFWKTVGRFEMEAEESRANERRARSERDRAEEADEGDRDDKTRGTGKTGKGKRGGRG